LIIIGKYQTLEPVFKSAVLKEAPVAVKEI
jgi:hypothetical protein